MLHRPFCQTVSSFRLRLAQTCHFSEMEWLASYVISRKETLELQTIVTVVLFIKYDDDSNVDIVV